MLATGRSAARIPAFLARWKSTGAVVSTSALVNPPVHMHDPWTPPPLDAKLNSVDLDTAVSKRHWDPKGAWSEEELREAQGKYVMGTWGPTSALDTIPMIERGEGIYLYDTEGRRYIDWTSQAICNNFGHTVPPAVIQGMNEQLDTLPHIYSGLGMVDIRCRLSALLAECLPGDLTGLLFPSGGAEANEAAVRIARRYTGRHKILTLHRSYHGGTSCTLNATGDFRHGFDENGASGFIKAINPAPMHFSWGETQEEATLRALAALEEQIVGEGPQTVAAMMLESIPGSAGVFTVDPNYMLGVRSLCDKYGILYIADEVMSGFGRTGTFWGFQHYPGLVPDIVTSAKGLSGAFQPISMVAVRSHIQQHFRTQPLGWGSTFQAHGVAMACAYECVKYMIANDVVGHAKSLEPLMIECHQHLLDSHPSVRGARVAGLFGCLDLQGPSGAYVQNFGGPPHPAAAAFKRALWENGIFGFVRLPVLHSAPALVISEAELRDGFQRVDASLDVLDRELGF